MSIPNSINNSHSHLISSERHIDVTSSIQPIQSIQSINLPIQSEQKTKTLCLDELSPFDLFWQRAITVGLVGPSGLPTEEMTKSYLPKSLDEKEFKCWFDFVSKPIRANFNITFSMLEFHAFLNVVAPAAGIEIISTSMVGGAVPAIFYKYYIRILNEVYKDRCKEMNIDPNGDLISESILEDFLRQAPDHDFMTVIKGNLADANKLVTKFLGWKLSNLNLATNYDLMKSVKDAIAYANKLASEIQNCKGPIESLFSKYDEAIANSFYRKYFDISDFALSSFGPDNFIIDHNFVHKANVDRTLFFQHALNVPFHDPITKLVEIVQESDVTGEECYKELLTCTITPTHSCCYGLPAIAARAGKRMNVLDVSEINDRGWGAFISNKSIGYDAWDEGLQQALFNKTKDFERLSFIKSKWINHHFMDRLSLVTLGFNALLSLPEDSEHATKCQTWWKAMKDWGCLPMNPTLIDTNAFIPLSLSPFFMLLKSLFDFDHLPFTVCRDFLQIYGCLALFTEQNQEPSALKIRLTNPEADWHEINFSQKIDDKNYAISIPLDLISALENFLKLTDSELYLLSAFFKFIYRGEVYKRGQLYSGLISEKMANSALKCFESSHKIKRALGYELLILYAYSKPDKWVLVNLIRYMPLICNDPMVVSQLEEVLHVFPDIPEIQKLAYPLKSFCQSNKLNSKNALYKFCLALASTDQSDIAKNLYSSYGLSVEEQIDFISSLLSKDPQEAARLFLGMQNEGKINENDEIKLFLIIASSILKNQKITYAAQLTVLAKCAKMLFKKQRMKMVLNPTFEPLIKIINSLVSLNFHSDALELLVACASQKIVLGNNNTDIEVWMNVCEAVLKNRTMDVKILKSYWDKRISVISKDQNLHARKSKLEENFKHRLHEKNSGILSSLQKLSQMSTEQEYIDLAVKVTIECANSYLSNPLILNQLCHIVNCYLNQVKDPGKQSKIREASLKIANALIALGSIDEAKKWMQRIFKIAKPLFIGPIEHKYEIFESQSESFSLLSLDLPFKPIFALETLIKLKDEELKVFKTLIGLLPRSNSEKIFPGKEERIQLIEQAKGCLQHSNSFVKRLGFEIFMFCAVPAINEKHKQSQLLLNILFRFLPIIISASEPNERNQIIDAMKVILQISSYADYAESYFTNFSSDLKNKKELYQSHCVALALTHHESLCEIGSTLISFANIDKLSPNFSLQEKMEIAIAFIKKLLPGKLELALKCVAELNMASVLQAKESKATFISLVEATIEVDDIAKAKELLSTCETHKIIPRLNASELWLTLLQRARNKQLLTPSDAAELILALDNKILPKQNSKAKVDLLLDLIRDLFILKNELANKLILHLNKFNLDESQQSALHLLIEDHIKKCLKNLGAQAAYSVLMNNSGLQLPQKSQLNLQKECLEVSMEVGNNVLAIEILSLIQKELEEGYLIDTFKALFKAVFKTEEDTFCDIGLEPSCKLLKKIDSKSTQSARSLYIVNWLTRANRDSVSYSPESQDLLKILLELCENGFSADSSVHEILEHLLKYLNGIETNTSQIPNELRSSIVGCYPIISQKLKDSGQIDKLCQYLIILQLHQISMKIPQAFSADVSWIAKEYLKNDILNPVKLEDIHNLLTFALHNAGSSHMELETIVKLATVLLSHNLLPQAMKWIDYAINELNSSKSSDADLKIPISSWCASLLSKKELELVKGPLKVLNKSKCNPMISAEIYLSAIKSFLHVSPEMSAQLLIDNWDLIQENCIFVEDDYLNLLLKDVIRNVYASCSSFEVLSLFISLMPLYKSPKLDFLLEQLQNCCKLIESMQPDSKESATALQLIDSIFFPENQLSSTNYVLIQRLIISPQQALLKKGVAQLNTQLAELLKVSIVKNPNNWELLSVQAIKNWFAHLKDAQMSSSELSELEQLIASYSKYIQKYLPNDRVGLERGLSLLQFQASLYQDWNGVENALDLFIRMLKKYGNDPSWVDQSVSLVARSLINVTMRTNKYLSLIAFYMDYSKQIFDLNIDVYTKFIIKYMKVELENTCQDSLTRSFLLFQAGNLLDFYVQDYKIPNEKQVAEIVNFVDQYLFCCPIMNHEYYVYVDVSKNEVDVLSYDLRSSPVNIRRSKSPIGSTKVKNHYLKMSENTRDPDDNTKNALVFEYALTREHFLKSFQTLQDCLHQSGHLKDNRQSALAFKLATTQDFDENIGEIFQAMDGIKSRDLSKTLQSVVNKYINHGIFPSLEKALSIMKVIPHSLWKDEPEVFANLLKKLINCDHSYPQLFTQIDDLFNHLHTTNQDVPNWSDIFSDLNFCFLDRFNQYLDVHEDLQGSEFKTSYLIQASNIFFAAMEQERIKKDHPKFVSCFKIHLNRMADLGSHRYERQYIAKIIEYAYFSNPAHKDEIRETITTCLNKIFIFKPEHIFSNVQVLYIISDNELFKGKKTQFVNYLKRIVDQIDDCLKVGKSINFFNQLMLIIINFKNIIGSEDKKISEPIRQKVLMKIDNKLKDILPLKPESSIFATVIENLLLLIEVQYFNTNSLKKDLEAYKLAFTKKFKLMCLNNEPEVKESLIKSMKSLIGADEVAKIATGKL